MEEKKFPQEILMSKILEENKKFAEAVKSGKEFSEVKEIRLRMKTLIEELNKLMDGDTENIYLK